MTATISTDKITIFLPTGELEIAWIIKDSCRRKPNWTVLASDAVRVLFVTGSVTWLSTPSSRTLHGCARYRRVHRCVIPTPCGTSHHRVSFAELFATRTRRGESPAGRRSRSRTRDLSWSVARGNSGSRYVFSLVAAVVPPPPPQDQPQRAPARRCACRRMT